jgi:hypothetical protein
LSKNPFELNLYCKDSLGIELISFRYKCKISDFFYKMLTQNIQRLSPVIIT